jgi:beta-N-acetylhexosaminidase
MTWTAMRALKAAGAFGWLMGAELRAFRVDLGFTPVVDLDLGLAEVIGDRALHADAQAVSDLAARIVEGATRAGLATCAKHFPSHAGAVADSHLEVATDNREFVALREDLAPYRHLISRGLHAVMLAHVKFPAIDPRPASMSPWWVGTALRGRLGFSGAVISDDMSMRGAEGPAVSWSAYGWHFRPVVIWCCCAMRRTRFRPRSIALRIT